VAKKILKGALGVVGGILGVGKKKKEAAPVEGPRVMPIADDEKVDAAKRADILRQRQRSGRESTILGGGEKLGSY
jgi:hypothetical protein